MRHLNIQIQPERAASLDMSRVKNAIEAVSHDHSIVAGFETKEGHDEGRYVNFTFAAKDLSALWQAIQSNVLADPEIGSDVATSSIIICEGEHGWDDYLLLHHFDPELTPDEL